MNSKKKKKKSSATTGTQKKVCNQLIAGFEGKLSRVVSPPEGQDFEDFFEGWRFFLTFSKSKTKHCSKH